ncbi:CCAAT/enhancer-binding protein zeta [Neosynchiropus ocellatus]
MEGCSLSLETVRLPCHVVCPHAGSSMAPKNKKKAMSSQKTLVQQEEAGKAVEEEEEEERASADVENDDEELSLEEVLRLGGTRADFLLLAGLDDSAELEDGGKKGAIDDLQAGELEQFISKLGIRALAGQQLVQEPPRQREPQAQPKAPTPAPAPAPAQQGTSDTTAAKGKKSQGSKDTRGKTKSKQNLFEFQQRQVLLVRPGAGKWFDLEYTGELTSTQQDPALVTQYKTLAQQLYQSEVDLYKTKKNLQKGANSAWMKTVVSSGVLADRMAAMTVLIQDAPVHMLEHVENLVSTVKKKGSRRMGLMALDTLRELLLSNLLPENRKLQPFASRPFDQLEERASGNREARDRRLVLWYFEQRLKHLVAEFVVALDAVAHDTVEATKTRALTTAHELLSQRPEQERALLVQVVNKLGDPEYKTAAKASYLLETLLHQHPNMRAVVCCEVERLMFRPNVGARAQYYAVCFLSQVRLSHQEAPLAAKLIAIYFSFFHACIKKKDVESKMLSVLLSGVNRAYPYARAGDEKVREQLDTLFKVVHLVQFNTAVQALMLLFQVMDSQQSVSDRYYVALYRKLLDSGLSSSGRQGMFLNLLYKSLKSDIVLRRVKAFIKRLLQVSAEQSASFACGALFLVSEVMKAKPGLKVLLQEAEDGGEEEFRDQPEEEEERCGDAGEPQALTEGSQKKPAASWVHHQNLEGGQKKNQNYDPLHRNPLFCGADRCTLWELQQLALHFHPSVALFARTLLQGESIQYSGDPLQDFTLIRFLDRFVFRNPKPQTGKRNTDAVASRPKHKSAAGSLPVNSEEFLSKDESQVPVDEVFFYRFFKKRQQERRVRRRADGDGESVDDVDDEEFERLLDSCEGDSYFPDMKDDDLDFASHVRSDTRKKKADGSDDSEGSDLDDLDDEEVSLGSMDEDFGDELEEEGGTFMEPDAGSDGEEVPELDDDDDVFGAESTATGVGGVGRKRKPSERAASATRRGRRKPESRDAAAGSTDRKRKKRESAVLAAAEEFAFQFGELLDENSGSKLDSMGLNAMANPDKAGVKQLRWEAQRDDWICGRDVKTLRRRKALFNRKRSITARRRRK